ncbi:MAG TPA: sulfur carrier protein ThiS [Nitrospiraceae bacterium]|jgi:thiamine biosynthesis protein ThiS|nr:sulfur carrier protein ThiS [Nitrospiraceae bacterium]
MLAGLMTMSQPATGALHIEVNGEPRTTQVGATVADLLQELDVQPDRVAVELNLQILDRQEFTQRGLHEGDRLEIISFIGGGSDLAGYTGACYE